jgi:hypothetical protein
MKVTRVELRHMGRDNCRGLLDIGFYVGGRLLQTFKKRHFDRMGFWYMGFTTGLQFGNTLVEEETIVLKTFSQTQEPVETLHEMLTLGERTLTQEKTRWDSGAN